jgi:D-glycero-alpha-D-manno-heptose 1-phosphate guanylyltransferase
MDIEAIILAGGFGTRLRSVIAAVPKPMAPVFNRPPLAYQLDFWMRQGVCCFISSVGYKHEIIQEYFKDSFQSHEHKAESTYSIEDLPMGTGGRFYWLPGSFLKILSF